MVPRACLHSHHYRRLHCHYHCNWLLLLLLLLQLLLLPFLLLLLQLLPCLHLVEPGASAPLQVVLQ